MSNKPEKFPILAPIFTLGLLVFLILGTYWGFNEPSDGNAIDKNGIYYFLNPLNVADVIGIILAYLGWVYCLVYWNFFWKDGGDKKLVNYAGIGAIGLGLLLIYIFN